MKILLDTHSLVWALSSPESLSKKARHALLRAELLVSLASLWELVLKQHKKRALLADPDRWWTRYVVDEQMQVVGIHADHILAAGRLPDIHRDPFDRLLVAQCQAEGASLMTVDQHLLAYKVPIIW